MPRVRCQRSAIGCFDSSAATVACPPTHMFGKFQNCLHSCPAHLLADFQTSTSADHHHLHRAMVHRSFIASLLSILTSATIIESSAFVPHRTTHKIFPVPKGVVNMKAYPTDNEPVYHQIEKDGKKPLVIGPLTFGASFFLDVQFWLTILLPFTIASTAANLFWVIICSEPKSGTLLDGTAIENKKKLDPMPMRDRNYDLVLLGVTGLMGKLAARHLARRYHIF